MKKLDYKILVASYFSTGLLFASFEIHAATPSLSYKMDGKDLTITYEGTLLQSSDAVNWTEVGSSSSPYKVKISDKKLFFCAKGESGGSEGQNFTIPLSGSVSLDMIWIEPGTFLMGSPEDELGRWDDETQHEVTLTQGYWMGKFEVTQAQYEAIMGKNPSYWKGADLPVECVSWFDATNFCARLTALEKAAGRLPAGYEYTLPTETQWEYACRAGTTTALNNGKSLTSVYGVCPNLDEVGWYEYNSGQYDSDGVWMGKGKTYPVGQKQPNAWGLYDMHGNVYEWCLDWYPGYEGSYRVHRGGSWHSSARCCRSAFRGYSDPSGYWNDSGFRVALSAVQ